MEIKLYCEICNGELETSSGKDGQIVVSSCKRCVNEALEFAKAAMQKKTREELMKKCEEDTEKLLESARANGYNEGHEEGFQEGYEKATNSSPPPYAYPGREK